jgi:hypothetical protein
VARRKPLAATLLTRAMAANGNDWLEGDIAGVDGAIRFMPARAPTS